TTRGAAAAPPASRVRHDARAGSPAPEKADPEGRPCGRRGTAPVSRGRPQRSRIGWLQSSLDARILRSKSLNRLLLIRERGDHGRRMVPRAAAAERAAMIALFAVVLQLSVHSKQNVPIVELKVNGRACRFIVDTGSSQTLVAQEIAMIIAPAKSVFRSDAGIEISGKYWEVDIDLGSRRWPKRVIGSIDMSRIREVYGKEVDGILGQDVLREFGVVTMNYRDRSLTLE